MRSLFTSMTLVSAVLVPWSSLAPASLQSSGGVSSKRVKKPAVELSAALGILPLDGDDFPDPPFAFGDSSGHSGPSQTRMVCENGVCRLVTEPASAQDFTEPSRQSPAQRNLQATGATQIRVESDETGLWRCSCSLPVTPGSKIMRRFETAAASETQALEAATQAVTAWLSDHR